jgi:hypothetical protein
MLFCALTGSGTELRERGLRKFSNAKCRNAERHEFTITFIEAFPPPVVEQKLMKSVHKTPRSEQEEKKAETRRGERRKVFFIRIKTTETSAKPFSSLMKREIPL